uniref:DUF4216 domain-containing protein n=1 Tax=Cannabis sativa TaxID=3483 RepID=A0A803NRX8_CANSA
MHVEKNVCDSLLATILDNDKLKDTINARHDLKKLGVREWLWIYDDGNVTLLYCKWFKSDPCRRKTITENNATSINVSEEWYKDNPFILVIQTKQVFYLIDLLRGRNWKIVEDVNHRQFWDIEDELDEDAVHDTSSSNFL